ncbi:MAG: T9SS type A sorting domain-containing protein [Crocinitomicaceae bacterium]|nr:T9SS type A sorting domain-containing protein [Crocinitomicaceae bacterium]
MNGSNIIDISIYPKKPRRKLEIIYFAVEKNQMNMSITDSEGRVVVQKTLSPESIGLNDLKLNIAKLSSGAYTLTISDGIHRDSKEFKKK